MSPGSGVAPQEPGRPSAPLPPPFSIGGDGAAGAPDHASVVAMAISRCFSPSCSRAITAVFIFTPASPTGNHGATDTLGQAWSNISTRLGRPARDRDRRHAPRAREFARECRSDARRGRARALRVGRGLRDETKRRKREGEVRGRGWRAVCGWCRASRLLNNNYRDAPIFERCGTVGAVRTRPIGRGARGTDRQEDTERLEKNRLEQLSPRRACRSSLLGLGTPPAASALSSSASAASPPPGGGALLASASGAGAPGAPSPSPTGTVAVSSSLSPCESSGRAASAEWRHRGFPHTDERPHSSDLEDLTSPRVVQPPSIWNDTTTIRRGRRHGSRRAIDHIETGRGNERQKGTSRRFGFFFFSDRPTSDPCRQTRWVRRPSSQINQPSKIIKNGAGRPVEKGWGGAKRRARHPIPRASHPRQRSNERW